MKLQEKQDGKDRVSGVTIAKVDENRKPLEETRQYISCDTLLLSVGLIPENELSKCAGIGLDRITNGAVVDQDRATEIDGIFACGNVLHVHDLVDFVSQEAEIAGKSAAAYILGKCKKDVNIALKTDGRIRYTVPQKITANKDVNVYFRVADVFCNVHINVYNGEKLIYSKKKKKAAPGEMESIVLKKEIFAGAEELYFALEG